MLDESNYQDQMFQFRTRQAGVSIIYDGAFDRYIYNVYCVETEKLKELYSCEFTLLSEALELVNKEFGTWELNSFKPESSGCGTCVAK